jgi:hypothetical protein
MVLDSQTNYKKESANLLADCDKKANRCVAHKEVGGARVDRDFDKSPDIGQRVWVSAMMWANPRRASM